jgi:uncharacterized protein YqgQ
MSILQALTDYAMLFSWRYSQMDQETLTISEFSKRAGLSRQAVYKKLDGVLMSYVVMVDGQKMLKREGLAVLKNKALTEINKVDTTKINTLYNDGLLDMISFLKEQIRVKDDQIAKQAAAMENHSITVKSLSDALQSAQALHAGTIQQQLTLPEKSGIWSRLFGKKDK